MQPLLLIPDQLRAHPSLVWRGRHAHFSFMVGVGPDDYVLDISAGWLTQISLRALPTDSAQFTISATEEAWDLFWSPVPPRDFHDLFSMLAAGNLRLDGNLVPLMQHLQYIKDLLALPRRYA